jgi:hypothetical protein
LQFSNCIPDGSEFGETPSGIASIGSLNLIVEKPRPLLDLFDQAGRKQPLAIAFEGRLGSENNSANQSMVLDGNTQWTLRSCDEVLVDAGAVGPINSPRPLF